MAKRKFQIGDNCLIYGYIGKIVYLEREKYQEWNTQPTVVYYVRYFQPHTRYSFGNIHRTLATVPTIVRMKGMYLETITAREVQLRGVRDELNRA